MRTRHTETLIVAAGALATGLLLMLAGCAGAPKPQRSVEAVAAEASALEPAEALPAAREVAKTPQAVYFADQWGIQIVGIRWTSGGYMLDFRFRVLDAQKAAPLFVRQTKPYLIDVRTGGKFLVPSPPKTGPLRTSNPPQQGRIYWMFFANPGQYIKRGNLVTVVIGDFQAENLTVE
jgi:hypothetical protein